MNSRQVHVINHPMVQHKLTIMREKSTKTGEFRSLLREISMFLGYEVMRDIPMTTKKIETPVSPMDAPVMAGRDMAFISIMRAGQSK